MRYGNDTETFYTYEPERRRLKNMIAETAANRKMMDNVYTYDKVSNILNLKNNAPIPTSNLMGSQTDYSFVYDDLYRLTSATGSNKGSNHEDMYTLKMAYNSVHTIVKKEQLHQFKSPNATNWSPRNKTTYTYNYQYGTAQPHAPIKIGNYSYTYDANGNQTGWDDNNSGQQRQILWDEENRIKAIEDNGALFSYVYDAGGERVLKSNGGGAQVSVNGSPKGGNGSIGNYTVYVNPYVVIRNGGATKHFYIESQRIATKILESKDGLLQNVTTTSTAPAGNRTVDYAKKQNLLENDLNLILAKVDGKAGNSGQTPPNGNAYGWGNGNNGGSNNGNGNNGGNNGGGNNVNGGGNTGGGTTPTGGGSNGNNIEKFVFYYHPDHLGSSSYITDVNGEVSQHIEYFAFGETFVEEHSNTSTIPYKFNAKELDDETGLYYYGARYYDPKTSLWQSVDPLADYNPHMNAEHFMNGEHNGGVTYSGNLNPYIYCYQNPIIFIDPNGKQSISDLTSGPKIDMKNAPPNSATNANGFARNGPWFWNQLLKKSPEMFSAENKALIKSKLAPVVDDIWIERNPSHSGFMGDKLVHHHVGQGRFAVGIPEEVHLKMYGKLHNRSANWFKMNGLGKALNSLSFLTTFLDIYKIASDHPDAFFSSFDPKTPINTLKGISDPDNPLQNIYYEIKGRNKEGTMFNINLYPEFRKINGKYRGYGTPTPAIIQKKGDKWMLTPNLYSLLKLSNNETT